MAENQRVMLTKRLLKESLIGLLAEKSIYQVSIRELCESAGINRSTFYKYYGSQFDLLKDMERDMLEHIIKTLTPRGDLISLQTLVCVLEYFEENIQLSRLLINNNVDPDFPRKLFQLEPIQEGLLGILRTQFDQNDLEYAFTYVSYGCYHMMSRWINKERREPIEKIACLLLEIVEKTMKEGEMRKWLALTDAGRGE